MTGSLFFRRALLPEGWAEEVRIRIVGGEIEEVTAGIEATAQDDPRPGVALPGLWNLHSHAHQRGIAGLGEVAGPAGGDDFWSWREAMYRAVARITPDDFEAIAAQLYVECLKAGYTGIAEFQYLHHDRDGQPFADPAEISHRAVGAAQACGLPITILPVLYQSSGFGGAPTTEAQRRFATDPTGFSRIVDGLLAAYADAADVRVGIAPHSLRAAPPKAIEAAVAHLHGEDPHAPVHIHIAEQVQEVADCLDHTGQRPVAWLLDHAPVDRRWCLIHATHMTDAETDALAASGAVAGLCPTTEANLGDGFFPAERYRAAGGAWGIGSDSHISVSPVEELRWLEYGVRLQRRGRTRLANPGQSVGGHLFRAAAAGGARASGFATGSLAVGHRADLVVLDDQHPLLTARDGDALLDSWVFAGNAPLVRDVWIGGKPVVQDFHHPAEATVAARYRATLRRILADDS